MSQREARLNLEIAGEQRRIAHASKRDSTAMKTLSVLGAVFLPGSFLASVFGMSFFNFEDRKFLSERRTQHPKETSFFFFFFFFIFPKSLSLLRLTSSPWQPHRGPACLYAAVDLLRRYRPHHRYHRRRVAHL
jgi:hypothetical protein